MDVGGTLWEIRRLRQQAAAHRATAATYMSRAGHGMSAKRATDRSGTGDCPLTDYAFLHAQEREAAEQLSHRSHVLMEQVKARMGGLTEQQRTVVWQYYVKLVDWGEIAKQLDKRVEVVWRLHRDAVRRMEETQPQA